MSLSERWGGLAVVLILSCSGAGEPPVAPVPAKLAGGTDAVAEASLEPAPSTVASAESFAYSTTDDPSAMQVLETGGAAFETLVSQRWLDGIVAPLRKEVDAIARTDASAGVGIRGNSHRLFNLRWLAKGHFELIGVTYRAERLPVDPLHCGDVRLVYRLAYRTAVSQTPVHSRLPMTVLVELQGAPSENGSCVSEAKRWLSAQRIDGPALGAFLLSGPLRDRLQASAVSQILVNAQIVRWPSAVRPSLGGHAEYSMLAFEPSPDGRVLQRKLLENMPNVKALRQRKPLRSELVSWIGQNLDEIDRGTAILPDRFLAKDALSVTPRSLSRRANRPFRQVFRGRDFAGLSLSKYKRISSPEALLRRLDDMSCVGCHQSRTIAGFHWLGVDDDSVAPGNALFVSRSVPLLGDARRRDRILLDLVSGRAPKFARPFAERDDTDPGIVGSRCGLGDPGFASWTCAEGLICDAHDAPADDALIGVCTSAGARGPGEACQVVAIAPHENPHRDRAKGAPIQACASGVCNINRTGFPGGMCTTSCDESATESVCGVIALLKPFNNCLARKTPFPKCLAEHVSPAGLRACDVDRPCRDDYVCARTPEGQGGCMPPYFLFQLRVDGHP